MIISLIFLIFLFRTQAIIFPPNEILEQTAGDFEEWRKIRIEDYKMTDHPFGWPSFNCGTVATSPSHLLAYPAGSVHELHPAQIGVVAALGDSISAGQAAKSVTILDILKKYPGENFVTGSDNQLSDQATLFKIFRQFSPSVKGGSSDRIQKFYDFNFAIPGSSSSELGKQAKSMAEQFRQKLGDQNDKTWKFVNIFIGHNDLCQICKNETEYGPESFGESIKIALEIIRENVPKVFINIMPPINVNIHKENEKVSKFCETSHRILCPCLFEMTPAEYSQKKSEFDKHLQEVVESFNREETETDDFAVVVSPGMDLTEMPKIVSKTGKPAPNTALIAVDCFHLSTIAHDIAAKQIWNGLFEPVGAKTVLKPSSRSFERFACPPPECPYLRTSRNSKSCVPLAGNRNLMVLEASSGSNSSVSIFMLATMFCIATVLVALFISSFRRRSHSSSSSDAYDDYDAERQQLLPIRADLKDNIF